jgi:hypothetical protein
MVEIGLAEYFGMGEAVGIIVTMFVLLYFSRKQMEALSVDIETKILSDLDLRIREITRMMIERPELIKVVSNVESHWLYHNKLFHLCNFHNTRRIIPYYSNC